MSWNWSSRSVTTSRSSTRATSWPPAPPTRSGAARPCSGPSSTWSVPGQARGKACRGSAPRPTEAAPAAQRPAFVHARPSVLRAQHDLRRAGPRRPLPRPRRPPLPGSVPASLAGWRRSRRGKALAAFLFIPIFALYEVFTQVVPRLAANGKLTTSSFGGVDSWLRWLPPGLAAHAIQDASTGHAGTALLRLALLAAIIVVLGWLWARALRRALVTADTSTQSSQGRGAAPPLPSY